MKPLSPQRLSGAPADGHGRRRGGPESRGRVPIQVAVEDLHNTGSCKGELIVDKWLFSYRSTDRPNDNRDWKLTELKAAESKKPDELVLRTRDTVRGLGLDKNYKFRVPGGIDRKVLDYMNERID